MKIKMTAVLLSVILPLSAWAASEPEKTQASATQQKQRAEWRQEKMQERQSAWFDRLELTAEQRTAFQQEMTEHREQQQKARDTHHEKLRALLDDKQRAAFDEDTKKMQDKMKNHMHKHGKSKPHGHGDYKHSKHYNGASDK